MIKAFTNIFNKKEQKMSNFDYNEYIREQQQQKHLKIKKTLKILGFIFLAVGAICALAGFIDFFLCFTGVKQSIPTLFFLCFIGLPLIAAGTVMLIFGFQREFITYGKNESAPVINEAAKDVAPAIQTIVNTVKDSTTEHDEAKNEQAQEDEQKFDVCPSCGHKNLADAKFCSDCGKPMQKTCPTCNESVGENDRFCPNCGRKL